MQNRQIKLGVQMYNFVAGGDWDQITTQREAEDLIVQLANAGYDGLEWLNFQLNKDFLDLHAIKSKMDEVGLSTCTLHFHCFTLDHLEENCRTAVERCRILDCKYLVFAFSLPKLFGIEPDEDGHYTPEQIDAWVLEADRILSMLRDAARDTDIRILYHNHNTEFLTGTDGRYFFDAIHPDGKEVDVYWTAKGLDGKVSTALDYIRKHRDSIRHLHLKDGLNGSVFTGEMCGWGKGTYPLQDVINCAKELEIPWIVIENDAPKNFGTSGLEDARESAAYAAANLSL